ncbi:MAG: hypothetical protein ACRD1Z_05365 [Vicinamibacteria bacterium]
MSNEPIACTLDSNGFRRRMEEFRDVFERGYLSSERFPGGGRFRFRAIPGLEAEIRSLAEREQACCRFFRFEIFAKGDELWWETRVDSEAEPVLEVLLELPDLLARRR